MFKSRFGYHACDLATYKKIKKLSALWFDALHFLAKWKRWNRKCPENRVRREVIRNSEGQKVGYGATIPWLEPQTNNPFVLSPTKLNNDLIQKVVEDKKNCRAFASPEEVKPLRLTLEEIDKLLG